MPGTGAAKDAEQRSTGVHCLRCPVLPVLARAMLCYPIPVLIVVAVLTVPPRLPVVSALPSSLLRSNNVAKCHGEAGWQAGR